MFDSTDEQNLIDDLREVGIALMVLLGIYKTGQRVEFDARRSQFIVDGRRLNFRTVQGLLSKIGRTLRGDMRGLTADLFAGKIDLNAWQEGMNRKITSGHWASAGLMMGGLNAASSSRLLTKKITREIKYVSRFKKAIASDKVSEARSIFRAGTYAESMRITANEIENDNAIEGGAEQAYRIQTAAESCAECEEYGEQWMPVEDMPEIGSLECGNYCKCVIIYEYKSEVSKERSEYTR